MIQIIDFAYEKLEFHLVQEATILLRAASTEIA